MKKEKVIYTIGHRNPDTDSICSAIGYAHLKQALGLNAIPARAGKINAETKYALEHFKMEQPLLITDLYPRVKDVMQSCQVVVKTTDSLRHLGEVMRESGRRSMPVVDESGKLAGMVTVSDLAQRYFKELNMQNLIETGVSYRDIINVIDGEAVVSGDEGAKVAGNVRIAAGSNRTIHEVIQKGDIVLIGDRRDETFIDCLNQDISCLVVTGNGYVSPDVVEAAEEKHIFIINSPYDTYTCARLINQCVPVGRIMKTELVTFNAQDMLSDIKGRMDEKKFACYPILENGALVGILGRDQVLEPEREQIILVDHNEKAQAVEGIEEAKILEIIDHHRLGGIKTSEPIFTRQEPVGCTATIVANMHWHRKVEIPQAIAGLLLSAILSDTVLFKSPTCTEYDKKTAKKLAELAGVNLQEYGMAMLKAGAGIGDMTPADIVKNDLKEFQVGDYRIIISQISVMDTKEVMDLEDQIIENMKSVCQNEGYNMSLVMVTDIIEEATYLLFAGSPRTLIGEAFQKDASGTHVYLPGVMSRKKQIVPPLSEAVKKIKN